MEYEGCYTFKPQTDDFDTRPNKRRRTQPSGLHQSWPARRDLFERIWTAQEERLYTAAVHINDQTITDIESFIDATYSPSQTTTKGTLLAGLITLGPNPTTQTAFFEELESTLGRTEGSISLVRVQSTQATNLKSLLGYIISEAIGEPSTRDNAGSGHKSRGTLAGYADEEDEANPDEEGDDADTHLGPSAGKRRLLKYDLQILADAVVESRVSKVVVAFQGVQSFNGALLSDLIDILSMWTDRIPLVLLFGIPTSIDALQAKLSRTATRCLRGKRFNTISAEKALETTIRSLRPVMARNDTEDGIIEPWIGGALFSNLLARQKNHIQSLGDFIDSIKYAYMTQFYANATTLFLDPHLEFQDIQPDHIQAVRNLPSFKTHVECLLDAGDTSLIRTLLTDDSALFEYVQTHVSAGCAALHEIWTAVHVIQLIGSVSDSKVISRSIADLYVEGFTATGRLRAEVGKVLLVLKSMASDVLGALLDALFETFRDDAIEDVPILRERLATLVTSATTRRKSSSSTSTSTALSPIKPPSSSLEPQLVTTIVSQRVELIPASTTPSKKKPPSRAEQEYASILGDVIQRVEDYLKAALIQPSTLVFNEIFIFDSSRSAVFAPKTRPAIERALSSPWDYLDCECCGSDRSLGKTRENEVVDDEGRGEQSLDARNPATSLLYQLYLESGALINVADLRTVFLDLVSDVVGDENQALALFQRSLAELSYLGFVKGTRRRIDHVVKLAWKGL